MTVAQLYLFGAIYLVILTAVALITRATFCRIAGAIAGAAVAGVAALGIIAFGERTGWWRMPMTWEPYYLTLFTLCIALCGFVFLLTWRIARRFGGRGLALVALIVAVLGPLRDSWYMARFPEWGSYAPGPAPMLATSASYLLLGFLGHGLMRLISGPAASDPLSRGAGTLARRAGTLAGTFRSRT